jgi:hypothetical protein
VVPPRHPLQPEICLYLPQDAFDLPVIVAVRPRLQGVRVNFVNGYVDVLIFLVVMRYD